MVFVGLSTGSGSTSSTSLSSGANILSALSVCSSLRSCTIRFYLSYTKRLLRFFRFKDNIEAFQFVVKYQEHKKSTGSQCVYFYDVGLAHLVTMVNSESQLYSQRATPTPTALFEPIELTPDDLAVLRGNREQSKTQSSHSHSSVNLSCEENLDTDDSIDTTKKSKVDFGEVKKLYDLPIKDAAEALGIGITYLKRLCRNNGVKRWPFRKYKDYTKAKNMLTQCFEKEE